MFLQFFSKYKHENNYYKKHKENLQKEARER